MSARLVLTTLCVLLSVLSVNTSNTTIGLSYSGGGITAILATMCSHHALREIVPIDSMDNLVVSTASGGTLGDKNALFDVDSHQITRLEKIVQVVSRNNGGPSFGKL